MTKGDSQDEISAEDAKNGHTSNQEAFRLSIAHITVGPNQRGFLTQEKTQFQINYGS